MSSESSPSQTPTVGSMGVRAQQSLSSLRTPVTTARSSAGPSPLSNPTTPETATFANTAVKKAPEAEKPLPPVAAPARSGTKARDLLRQHYGMAVGPPAPLPGRPDDPMDIGKSFQTFSSATLLIAIDSPTFDAKAYYNQLITTTSLTGLLKRENELYAG